MITKTYRRKILYHYLLPIASLSVICLALFTYKYEWIDFQRVEPIVTDTLPTPDTLTEASFMFAGDVMQHKPQINASYNSETKTYNFEPCFKYVRDLVNAADMGFANLETTLSGEPYTGFPRFSAPDEVLSGLQTGGFDFIVTANNHSVDRGKEGIIKTLDALNKYKLPCTGTFYNKAHRDSTYPYFLTINKIKFALLNYTYGTNGFDVPPPVIVNLIDTVQIRADFVKALIGNPDAIIVQIHWGEEYQRKESRFQRNIADFLIKMGADLIIGAHPHVVQPIEWRQVNNKKALVAYSLGNFISNQRKPNQDGGLLFYTKFQKNLITNKIEINNAGYIPTWVHLEQTTPAKKSYFVLPAAQYQADSLQPKLGKDPFTKLQQYLESTRILLNKNNQINEINPDSLINSKKKIVTK